MRPLSADTDPAVERVQLAIMARLPAWRKLELLARLNALLSGLAVGGIKARHPDAHSNALWRCLDEQRLGAEAAGHLEGARRAGRITPEESAYVAGDPIPTTLAVIAALDRLGVAYYVGGSLASSIYGTYRATADVDIVADLTEDNVDALVRLLGQGFYADAAMMRDAIRHRASFNVLDVQTGFKVDVFIPQGRPFDRSQFARRARQPLDASGRESAYVASAEDAVLAKLEWYRMGGACDRQWDDALGMLKVRASEVDTAYLHHWAAQLGLEDLLARALDEAGLTQP